MQTDLSDIERRVKRYWFTDGLGELIGGGGLILLGIYFGLQEFLNPNSLAGAILGGSFAILFIGVVYASQWLVNRLKTRLTYPRTGYIEYQVSVHPPKRRWVLATALTLAAVVSALTMALVSLFHLLDAMVAFTGLVVGLIFMTVLTWSSGLTRFFVLGCISLVLGLALARSGLPNGYSMGLFYGLMGIFVFISGGLTLWHYLQHNPMPAESENG